MPFHATDIDVICTLCYNWGVTLVELGQFELAEKFACKALSFANHTSLHVHSLRGTMQVSGGYTLLL